MRARVDAFDWSRTPLGPRAGWPAELEIAVRQMLDSQFPKAVVWGSGLTTIYNDGFVPILGAKTDGLGCSFAEIWSEIWDEIGPIAARAYTGVPTYIEDCPLTINRWGHEEKAWFTFCYSPLRLADGSVGGMLDTVVETTGKMLVQNDLALVNQELGHRLKNTLAIVNAIASQTFRGSAQTSEMESFSSRLMALGHAHDILLHHDWSRASLSKVIAASLEPHDAGSRIRMSGQDMVISPRAAVAVSLMFHELATNAVKYGALSTPHGQVDLQWSRDGDTLRLQWHEAGGPPVTVPQQQGFGSRLIDMGLGAGTTIERRFEPDGLKLEVSAAVGELLP